MITVASPAPFATSEDYTRRGLDQGPWTTEVLNTKLAEASRKIRERAKTVDARISAGTLDAELVADIACAMVSRAVPMETGLQVPSGAQSAQVSVDIFQQSIRFGAGGAAALFFTREERRTLGIGGGRVAFVDPLGDDESGHQ